MNNKEQLYDVFVEFKDADKAPYRDRSAISATVVGMALVIESRYKNGIGKVIYSLDKIQSCTVVPLSDDDHIEE